MIRILYPAKLFFKSEGEIKASLHKQKLRECVTKTLPCRDDKGSLLFWKGRTPDGNSNSHKDIKSISRGIYIGKY